LNDFRASLDTLFHSTFAWIVTTVAFCMHRCLMLDSSN